MKGRIVKNMLFFCLFLLLYISIFKQYKTITNAQIIDVEVFSDFFLSKQKMLFNNTLLFSTFLHINHNTFLKNIVVLRYEKNFTKEILLNSLIRSFVFVGFIYLSSFISSFFIFDNINFSILSCFTVLFPFFLRISLLYNFIYYIKQNYVYSFLFIILESLIILISYIGLGFVGIDIEFLPDLITCPVYCLGLSLALGCLILGTSKRRDYI